MLSPIPSLESPMLSGQRSRPERSSERWKRGSSPTRSTCCSFRPFDVGDPEAPPLGARELLRLLDRHGVRYVVVGGLAATAHGATRVTFDIDVVPEWSDDNLERLALELVSK